MNSTEYADFATMRAELSRDYAPANAPERLLVMEVAAAWRRLDHCRRREDLFFDLQRHAESYKTGVPKEQLGEGSEVMMWAEKPQRAYDQVLASIREAHVMFDRAVRRIEDVQERRRKREIHQRKEEVREAKAATAAAKPHHSPAKPAQAAGGTVVQLPINRAPENEPVLKT